MKKKTIGMIVVTFILGVALTLVATTIAANRTVNNGANSGTINGTNNAGAADQSAIDKLVEELYNVELLEDQLDIDEDALELSYRNGEIDLDTYKTKMAELEKEDRTLEQRENEIEKELKKLRPTNKSYYDEDDHDFDD